MKIVKSEINRAEKGVSIEVSVETDTNISEIEIGGEVYFLDTSNLENICVEILSLIDEVKRKERMSK